MANAEDCFGSNNGWFNSKSLALNAVEVFTVARAGIQKFEDGTSKPYVDLVNQDGEEVGRHCLNFGNYSEVKRLAGDSPETDDWVGMSLKFWCDPSVSYSGHRGGLKVYAANVLLPVEQQGGYQPAPRGGAGHPQQQGGYGQPSNQGPPPQQGAYSPPPNQGPPQQHGHQQHQQGGYDQPPPPPPTPQQRAWVPQSGGNFSTGGPVPGGGGDDIDF